MKSKDFREELKKKMDKYVHFVYKLTRDFPEEEKFGVTSQIRRASLSVILNFIEGYARIQRNVQRNFFEISYGSLKESKYLLYFSLAEKYISKQEYKKGIKVRIDFLHDVQLSDYVHMSDSGFVSIDMDNLNFLPGNDFEKNVTVKVNVDGCSGVVMYHSSQHVTSQAEWDANKQICTCATGPACCFVSCSGGIFTFTIEHLDGAGGE